MDDPQELENEYLKYIEDLAQYAPDGIIDVDIALLQDLNLLEYEEEDDSDLTHSFYVVESNEKITLFNERFVVWIVPKMLEEMPATFTLIALNNDESTHLEMVFSATGVYNHSSLVLRILEKLLEQIEENESEIVKINQQGS